MTVSMNVLSKLLCAMYWCKYNFSNKFPIRELDSSYFACSVHGLKRPANNSIELKRNASPIELNIICCCARHIFNLNAINLLNAPSRINLHWIMRCIALGLCSESNRTQFKLQIYHDSRLKLCHELFEFIQIILCFVSTFNGGGREAVGFYRVYEECAVEITLSARLNRNCLLWQQSERIR